MHEQSIVESLLALALEHAGKENAAGITKINVVVGELSGVVEESADFYFSFLRKGTLAEGASLSFTRAPARLHCRSCDTTYSPEKLDFRCPACQEPQVEIVGGRELYLESIEVV